MAYTPQEKEELLNRICNDIAEGSSLRSVLLQNGMPHRDTFYDWIKNNQSFSDQYARACEDRADLIFEDILNIADDNGKDTRVLEDGREATDHDVIQRARLRVDARKWMLSKMQPKKYGDRVDVTSGGEKIKEYSIDDIKRELKELFSEDD